MGLLMLFVAAAMFLSVLLLLLLPLLMMVAALWAENKKPVAVEQVSRNGQASGSSRAMRCTALGFAAVFGLLFGSVNMAQAETHEVVGKADNTWEYKKAKSPKEAAVGKPEGRLKVKVRNGDTVVFRAEGEHPHNVIFEKATTELKAGVWEIVKGSGTLGTLHEAYPYVKKTFDLATAQQSNKKGEGKLIEIRINALKAGDSILFACNPHSGDHKGGDGTMVRMLGVIVLDPE